MEYSKLEIDRAAHRVRDELKASAAVLAVSLARQSLRLDVRTAQEIVKGVIKGLKHHEIIQTTSQPPARAIANM